MTTGFFTADREPALSLEIRGPDGAQSFDAVIDTGYNGALTLPPDWINALGLPQSGEESVSLADGRVIIVPMEAEGLVFTDRDGEPIRPGRVTTRFKDMTRKADLDERIHFHSLRHTTGSWLAMKGVPMKVIQEILGHSSLSVTEKYSHLAPETLDAAMEETFGEE